jgi:hypothetical protein
MPGLLCLVALVCGAETSPAVSIETVGDPSRIRVRAVVPPRLVKDLPAGALSQEQGEALLQLCLVDQGSGQPGPPIFGTYERQGDKLVFVPRHPLLAGQRYQAILFRGKKDSRKADHVVPARRAAAPARVEKVYPTASELPANQLKFYIYFSRPMRESRTIFDHIRLLDEKGKPVADPWRRTELWSRDGRRLTLWIHPGRIKKGVNLREELGPVLEPDRTYSLVIGKELLDTDGQALAKAFTKKFRATRAVRLLVDIDEWKLAAPKVGTKEPLVLRFPRPLDQALLQRFVRILREGEPVAGRIELGKEERSLAFVPRIAWQAKAYQVVVDDRLEDLAGNTPEQLFDVDNDAADPAPPRRKIAFRPRER